MQVVKTDIDALNATLTITVEAADYQEEVEKQIIEFRKKANMPGFRPGMVPKGLVKKMYGKAIMGEAVNKAINKGLFDYIKEQDLNILGDPMPNENDTDAIDWDNQDAFTFVFDIALAPEMDAKLNGKNKLTYYDVVVSDEMVNNQVNSYAERFGEYVSVDDVVAGDMVKGLLTEQKDGGIVKENATLMPAYMKDDAQKALFIGAKKGDVITFNPAAAYGNEAEVASLLGLKKEEAANLNSDFTFEIQEITRHQAAAIDAELFAKVYGENNVKDEADFREKVRAEIKANMDEDAKYKFGLDAKAAILKKVGKVEFPEAFLKRWVKATNEKMTDADLEKDFPQMLEELRWQLAKDQLMKVYDIKVDDADVKAYAREIARMQFMQYGMMHVEDQYLDSFAADMLKKEDQVRGIVERVVENKIYDAVKGVVKVETKEISHEDFGKLFKD